MCKKKEATMAKVLRIAENRVLGMAQIEDLGRVADDDVSVETMVICLLPMTEAEFVSWFDNTVTDAGKVDIVALETPGISIKLINKLLRSSKFLVARTCKLLIPAFEDGKFTSYGCYSCLI
jgi:hypothetical protein